MLNWTDPCFPDTSGLFYELHPSIKLPWVVTALFHNVVPASSSEGYGGVRHEVSVARK